ncbi:hypothetical protein B4079_1516 [Bacillus cereus]|nr:hypothetical protein B4079_1516 [Bacillus cereus]
MCYICVTEWLQNVTYIAVCFLLFFGMLQNEVRIESSEDI